MKKQLFIALSLLLLLWIPRAASAHVLVTDGSIGAVMHIDPDDDPVAGDVSTFNLDFQDKANKFSLSDCACTFTITETGKALTTQPVTVRGTTSATAKFNFPKRDVYELIVAGTPKNSASFKDFSLNYSIRVERGASESTKNMPKVLRGSFLVGISSVGVFLVALCYTLLTPKKERDGK